MYPLAGAQDEVGVAQEDGRRDRRAAEADSEGRRRLPLQGDRSGPGEEAAATGHLPRQVQQAFHFRRRWWVVLNC